MSEVQTTLIPVAKIEPNPWNPNRMNEEVRRAARESIQEFGFIDPITVRKQPGKRGRFEIIDGQHRWEEASGLGLKEIPAIILELTDPQAKKLTIVLNEIKGEADLALTGGLLAELKESLDADTFALALPWNDQEIDHLLRLGAVDWDKFDGPNPDGDGGPGDDDQWFSILIRAPEGLKPIWEQAVADAKQEGIEHQQPAIEAGMILEWMLANRLASG